MSCIRYLQFRPQWNIARYENQQFGCIRFIGCICFGKRPFSNTIWIMFTATNQLYEILVLFLIPFASSRLPYPTAMRYTTTAGCPHIAAWFSISWYPSHCWYSWQPYSAPCRYERLPRTSVRSLSRASKIFWTNAITSTQQSIATGMVTICQRSNAAMNCKNGVTNCRR